MTSAYDVLVQLLTDWSFASWRDPNPLRSRVTALEHAVQTASRAEKAGYDDQHVVMALVHDAGRPLNEVWHGEVIAEVFRDRLYPDMYDALKHHGVFQSDLVHGTAMAERWREERWFPVAQRLAGWDAASFDPDYQSLPLDHFLPKLAAVMA